MALVENIKISSVDVAYAESSVYDRLRRQVLVTDYYSGSGDYTDAFAAALSSGAQEVMVPSGTYEVATITVPDNVSLTGFQTAGLFPRINLTGASASPVKVGNYSCISGLYLDFSAATGVDKALLANATQGTVIKNNRIKGAASGHTVYLDGRNFPAENTFSDRNEVVGNIITGGQGAGIYVNTTRGFLIEGNRLRGTGDGISCTGTRRLRVGASISNNEVLDSAGQGIATVLISNARDQQAYEGVVVTNNRVLRAAQNGIVIQSDLTTCSDNFISDSGSTIAHQGILVNANSGSVTGNVVRRCAGVGIDFGNCRKFSCTGNLVEECGWHGIEVNRSEQMTVTGNVLNLNFRGKTGGVAGDLQAAIICHLGSGGYPFSGPCQDVTITGNTIQSGAGQTYAILVAAGVTRVTVIGNTCPNAALLTDIETYSPNVVIKDNYTRWNPYGTSRATIVGETCTIPSEIGSIYINGTGNVQEIITSTGAIPDAAVLRVTAVNGFTLKVGTNVSLAANVTLSANQSYVLYWNRSVSKWTAWS